MDFDETIPDRFLPPEPRSNSRGAAVRWAVTLIALVVLVAVAYKAYGWLAGEVAQHTAAAAPGGVAVPPPVEVPGLAQSGDTPQDATPGQVPIAVADLGSVGNPDQRRSVCGYLAAEAARLNHEFKQPLPPPIIDRIATETEQLRAQNSRYGCGAPGGAQDQASAPAPARATPAADD